MSEPFTSRQLESDPLRASILDEVLNDLSSVQPWKSYSSECSYCRRQKNDGRAAYGIHAHKLNVIDYEDLLEMGFIRSGRHVYKPLNDITCCPNYAIRLDALSFLPSRSHVKVLKKLSEYLTGIRQVVLPQKVTDPFSRCYSLVREGRAQEAAEAVVNYHDSGDISLSSALGIQFLDEEHKHEENDEDAAATSLAGEMTSEAEPLAPKIPPTLSLFQPLSKLTTESIEKADEQDICRLAVAHSLSSFMASFFTSPLFHEVATLALTDVIGVSEAISRCTTALSRIHISATSKKIHAQPRSFSCNVAFVTAAAFFLQSQSQEQKVPFQSKVADAFVRYVSLCSLDVSVVASASGPGFVNLILSPTEDLVTIRANLLREVKNSPLSSSEIVIPTQIAHVPTLESILEMIPEPLNCISVKTQQEHKALRVFYNHQQEERERIGRLKLQRDAWHVEEDDDKPEVISAMNHLEELYDKEDFEAVKDFAQKLSDSSTMPHSDYSIPPTHLDSATLEQSARRALLECQESKSAEREISLSAAKVLAEAAAEKRACDENIAKAKETLVSFVEMGLGSRMERLRRQAESNAVCPGDHLLPFGPGKHKLTVTLTRPEYSLDSHEIYARFNMALHRGYPSSQTRRNYTRHLIDTPVEPMAAWKLGKAIASACTQSTDEGQEVAQLMRNEVDELLSRGQQFHESIQKDAQVASTEKIKIISEEIPKRSVIRIARTLLEPIHAGVDSASSLTPSLDAVLRSLAIALNEPSLEPCDEIAPEIVMSLVESSGPSSMWMLSTLQEIFNPTALGVKEAVERASTLLAKAQEAHVKASESISSSSSLSSSSESESSKRETNDQPDAKKSKLASPYDTEEELKHAQVGLKNALARAPLQFSAPTSLFRPPAVPKCLIPLLCELADMHSGRPTLRSGVILGIYLLIASLVEKARARLLLIRDHEVKMALFQKEYDSWMLSHPHRAVKLEERRRLIEAGHGDMDVELTDKLLEHNLEDDIDDSEKRPPPENQISLVDGIICESCLTEDTNAVCLSCGFPFSGQVTCESCGALAVASCRKCGALETSPFPPERPVGPDSKWLSEETIERSYSIIYETARLMEWQGSSVERLLRRTGSMVSTYSENIRNRQRQRAEQLVESSSTTATSRDVSPHESSSPSSSSDALFSQYFTKMHTPGCLRHGAEQYSPPFSESSPTDSGKIAISGWDLPFGFGTFFHEYRLDGELVAISVLDILPTRVASIYFFYDPDFRYLELGKISALVEIWMVQQISSFTRDHPELTTCLPSIAGGSLCRHWDANFYVHSCAQMNYKRTFQPSEIQCPKSNEWVRLNPRSLKLLDKDPQATLSMNPSIPPMHLNSNFGPRSLIALPRVMVKLDGAVLPFPFAGLTEHSQRLCRLGIEQYIMTVGRDFSLSVLCDPNGVASETVHHEKKILNREKRRNNRVQRQEDFILSLLLPSSSSSKIENEML